MTQRHAVMPFVKASAFHIGAAAATVSLRKELVEDHQLAPGEVDLAYAVSRLTPGTNLLAMYTILGHRVGGWPLALQALAVGVLVPSAIAVALAFLYSHADAGWVEAIMKGARAGGIAVVIGAAVRLVRPQIAHHRSKAAAIALAALLAAWANVAGPLWVLLGAAAVGAAVLRER